MYTQTIPPDPLSVWNKPVKHVKRLTLKNNMSMNVLNLTELQYLRMRILFVDNWILVLLAMRLYYRYISGD